DAKLKQADTSLKYAEASKAKAEAATAGTLKIKQSIMEGTVNDEQGHPIGWSGNKRAVVMLGERIAKSADAVTKMNLLADDIKRNGVIMNPYSENAKHRMQLYHEVQEALGQSG